MWRLILALVVFAVPTVGVAESILVEPLEWDFGELEVGDWASKLFLISTDDPYTPLTIGGITIEDDPFSAFDITRIDPIPPELYITDPPIEIEVTFTPPSQGLFGATLTIESNDTHHYPPDGLVLVPLSGSAVPEPGTFAVWSVLTACGVGIGWYRRRKAS